MQAIRTPDAALLLPDAALSGCLFTGILRDTRARALSDSERFNHFPASPLVVVTLVADGETRLLARDSTPDAARRAAPMPPISVMGPQSQPITSWTPGPVQALSIGFFPEAYGALTGLPPQTITNRPPQPAPSRLCRLLRDCGSLDDPGAFWARFQSGLGPLWQATRPPGQSADIARLSDWSRSVATRAALSGPGRSLRAAERRLRRWTRAEP